MENPRHSAASATKSESLQRQMVLFPPCPSLFSWIMAALNPRQRTEMNRAEFLLHHTGDRRKKVVNPLEKTGQQCGICISGAAGAVQGPAAENAAGPGAAG